MDELADSRSLADDPLALRARLAADGYVFLRGLLPADRVGAAGELIAATLHAGGWTAAGSPRLSPAAGPREALADPAYRAAVLSLAFNELPYLAPLRGTVRRILGPGAFSYPVKVLRAVAPESPVERTRGRYVHCDYMGSGVQDMLTTWMPLADVPSALGGLAVLPGGHRDRPRHRRPLGGGEPGWASTDYRPGDVVIFHCLTPHAALPNTAHRLRLSADFRWQEPGYPAPAEMILGPAGRPPELLRRLLCRQAWWEPVPPGLTLRPRAELAAQPPRPSRLFAVSPGWRRWKRYGGPVSGIVGPFYHDWKERRPASPYHKGDGHVTDDTLMTGLLTRVYAARRDHLDTYDVASSLVPLMLNERIWIPELHEETIALKRVFLAEKWLVTRLHYAHADPREAGVGNMVNCGAAMYMAPVGIVNAGSPAGAYAEAVELASTH